MTTGEHGSILARIPGAISESEYGSKGRHMDSIENAALFVLAIWGGVLTTYHAVRFLRRDSRRVRVILFNKLVIDVGSETADILCVKVTNIGHRNVTASSLAIELPSKECMWSLNLQSLIGLHDTQLPVTLGDGQSAFAYFGRASIYSTLRENRWTRKMRLTPICIDSFGKVHRGRSWRIDPV